MYLRFMSRPDREPDAVDPSPSPEGHSAAAALGPDGFILRPAVPEDLHLTARAHVDLLPFGLFPSLGVGFVRRRHRTFLDSPHGAGYVVIDPQAPGNGTVGFLLGTTDQAAHTAAVLADRRTMAVLALSGAAALCAGHGWPASSPVPGPGRGPAACSATAPPRRRQLPTARRNGLRC